MPAAYSHIELCPLKFVGYLDATASRHMRFEDQAATKPGNAFFLNSADSDNVARSSKRRLTPSILDSALDGGGSPSTFS
jgi:hypothetical protein